MIVTLKKIMNLINTINAPVHYYSYEGGYFGFLIYLQTVSKQKQKEFARLQIEEQREYVSDSAEIFIPMISPDYLAEIYKASASHDYPYTLSKVKNIANVSKEDEHIAVSLYMLLHELGHWDDFVKCGKKPYLYTMPDSEEAKKVHDYGNQIQLCLNGKSVLTQKDHSMLEDFIQKYYSVPIEKRANDYADEHYFDMYELLRKNGLVYR